LKAYTVARQFAVLTIGTALESTTRTFSTPYTLNFSSTTPPSSCAIIAQLPAGCRIDTAWQIPLSALQINQMRRWITARQRLLQEMRERG
jgi:hypothetical protein